MSDPKLDALKRLGDISEMCFSRSCETLTESYIWTDITCEEYARKGLRLPSDLTDVEWAIFEPLMPIAAVTGRPLRWAWRELLNAMLYLLRNGLPWRMLPPGLFTPVSTMQRWFYIWRDDGLWRAINHEPVIMVREAQGHEACPSTCVIDSQSAKTTESGGPRGYDAGKKRRVVSAILLPIRWA